MNGNVNTEDSGKTTNIAQRIAWITGVLIAVAAMINSAKDVYVEILDLPIGASEKIFDQKRSRHFQDEPIFDEQVEIPVNGSHKTLGIYVYSNADVYVNYSGVEQWLPFEELSAFNIDFSPISSAHAFDLGSFGMPKAVLHKIDIEKVKSLEDLERIKEEKTSSLDKKIEREYWFEETKNDNPSFFSPSSRNYSFTFKAIDGYKIDEYKVISVSQNNAKILQQSLNENSTSLTLTVSLTSGPAIDRWRGWLKGKIVTSQTLLAAP